MNVTVLTGDGDLPILESVVSVRRAINVNVIMVSRNNHFLVSIVVMMMMRAGRAADTNVVMIPSNNHFLVPIVMMMVVGVVVGRTTDANMVMIPSNNDLVMWPVVMMMVVVVVGCARIKMVIWKSSRHFNKYIYFGTHAYHQTTAHSVASWDGTDSNDDPIRINEDDCKWRTMRSENTHFDFPAPHVHCPIVIIRGTFIFITCGHILFSVRAASMRSLLITFVTRTSWTVT
jgi:hypothetical protein